MHGVWTALITPFNDGNEVDLPAFKTILKNQASAGVTGVVACGSTGESATLSVPERRLVIQTTLKELKGTSVKVFAGTGTNNTAESREFSLWAQEQGVDGVMLVNPFYNKPSQAGLEAHFRTIADALRCEVMLYNHPGRTGVCLNKETILRLSTHPQITSLKDATGQLFYVNDILDGISKKGSNLKVFSGDDGLFLPLLSIGGVGVISVASNLIPFEMMKIYQCFEKGEIQEATALHQKYFPLFRDLGVETNPVPIKYAMAYAGWCKAHIRLPLVSLEAANETQLKITLKNTQIKPRSFV